MKGIPTKEDIELLARFDNVLYRSIKIGELQGLSWDEIMRYAIKCLVEHNKELHYGEDSRKFSKTAYTIHR